jgi:hypothetical protein
MSATGAALQTPGIVKPCESPQQSSGRQKGRRCNLGGEEFFQQQSQFHDLFSALNFSRLLRGDASGFEKIMAETSEFAEIFGLHVAGASNESAGRKIRNLCGF